MHVEMVANYFILFITSTNTVDRPREELSTVNTIHDCKYNPMICVSLIADIV